MPKVAICKSTLLGSPCLVLGIYNEASLPGHQWLVYQRGTLEEYLTFKCKYMPPYAENYFMTSWVKNQEQADAYTEEMKALAMANSKFHKDYIHFENLNKTIPVTKGPEPYSLEKAIQMDITREEVSLLFKDLNDQDWQAYDWESWAK